jgi:peptide-methionine (S)-S-oxide reductase
VVRTRVGYTGGTSEDPTYYKLGDHIETVEVEFHPPAISYEQLLDIFWRSHDPTRRPWSRQYMSAIFHHNEEQKRLALITRDRQAAKRGGRIYTEIAPAVRFYRAEDYHQKYYLRKRPELMSILRTLYPKEQEFIDSTAAAAINGYIAGHGQLAEVESKLLNLDLSELQKDKLLELLGR